MRLYLNVTLWPDGKKSEPIIGLVEGDVTIPDIEMQRLAQVLLVAASVEPNKAQSPRDICGRGKDLLEEWRKTKMIGRASEFNDESRQSHLAAMRVQTARENEFEQLLRELVGNDGEKWPQEILDRAMKLLSPLPDIAASPPSPTESEA